MSLAPPFPRRPINLLVQRANDGSTSTVGFVRRDVKVTLHTRENDLYLRLNTPAVTALPRTCVAIAVITAARICGTVAPVGPSAGTSIVASSAYNSNR